MTRCSSPTIFPTPTGSRLTTLADRGEAVATPNRSHNVRTGPGSIVLLTSSTRCPRTSPSAPPQALALDAAGARRAQVRALAATLVDGPRMRRRFHVPGGVPLQPSDRRRHHGPRIEPPPRSHGGVAGAPPCCRRLPPRTGGRARRPAHRAGVQVHTVEVTGDHLLSRATVLAAAHIPQSSLFTVDGEAIRARLTQLPWVRAATVTTQLPSTVEITVTEWQPDLLLRHGERAPSSPPTARRCHSPSRRRLPQGHPSAARLPARRAAATADRARRPPRQRGPALALGVRLLRRRVRDQQQQHPLRLVQHRLAGHLRGAGQQRRDGGHPRTAGGARRANGRLDFAHPAFGYVDLENPAAPAIGGHPGEPASLRADIAAARCRCRARRTRSTAHLDVAGRRQTEPHTTAAAAPTPTPAPTPRPTPSPLVLSIPPRHSLSAASSQGWAMRSAVSRARPTR